jgi:hypothetical protein
MIEFVCGGVPAAAQRAQLPAGPKPGRCSGAAAGGWDLRKRLKNRFSRGKKACGFLIRTIAIIRRLEGTLRKICDPESVDARAKDQQRRHLEKFGGREAVLVAGAFVYTPPPGVKPELEKLAI